jgi:uncharacterized protein YndB with AHSA1/START domain
MSKNNGRCSMGAEKPSDPPSGKNPITVERKSDREIVVTRRVNGPARIVFEAWTKPELFRRWWAPQSFGVSFISCDLDACTGGKYRIEMRHPSSAQPMAFFGRYIEVIPHSLLVWTNDEGGEGGAVTTVTFEEKDGATLVVVHELYPSKRLLTKPLRLKARADGVSSSGSWTRSSSRELKRGQFFDLFKGVSALRLIPHA